MAQSNLCGNCTVQYNSANPGPEYDPVRRHWFYILVSLADRDRHGSAIMRDVLELTDGALKLWPVTLYGTLDELHEQGLIRALDRAPADAKDDSARKRWFHITTAGRRELAVEVARLREMTQVASRRLARGSAS